MTIDELLAAAGLTANDEIPIWDKEATGEPTKKITAANLASAVTTLANLVTGVKGNAEAENAYRHGNVNLTPANIGAHPARANLQVTNNSSYTGTPAAAISQPIVQILDSSGSVRHQIYGLYSTSGSFYTYIAARRPSGSSAVTNQIGIGFDANGNGIYSVSYPEAFRSAIGVTPANNLTTTEAGKVLDARQGAALKALIDGLISNTSLGAYSGYAAAAEAVWAAMGNTSVKVGEITIKLSSTNSYIAVYLAVKSSDNYAAVLFVSYSTTLHLAIKLSGTTTVRNISTTAE